jgi:hypothetical protein
VCIYAECRHAKWHYAERRSAFNLGVKLRLLYVGKLRLVCKNNSDNGWIYSTNLGQCYKYITIVNDDSRLLIMMLQVVASPVIIILMTLQVSFTLLGNI